MKIEYQLRLDDGTSWVLSAMEELQPWLNSFATIMELRHCPNPNGKKMFFITTDERESGVFLKSHRLEPPKTDKDWRKFRHSGAISYLQHRESGTTVVRLNTDLIKHKQIKYIAMWTALRPIFEQASSNGGLPLHAASASLMDNGILIAAAGGTGKSTCVQRLPPYWNRLADDQVLILSLKPKEFRFHPLPSWSNYLWEKSADTWDFQQSSSLRAIFFLEQAATDYVIPLKLDAASVKIFKSCQEVLQSHWARLGQQEGQKQRALAFQNACLIAKIIPTYRLLATLQGDFWEKIEEQL